MLRKEITMKLRTLSLLAVFALTGCQISMPYRGANANNTLAMVEIIEAEASLHRLADLGGEPMPEDLFVLRTSCRVKVTNNSGKNQAVMTYFGSPYDDLRLRIRDSDGSRLATTSHTMLLEPVHEVQWYELGKGSTVVQLNSATPVGPAIPDPEFPFITDKKLTPTIMLEYFGGFPSSDLRATQSNRVQVEVDDRTAVVPRKSLPLPPTHV